MSYITKEGKFGLRCNHPKVKEIHRFGGVMIGDGFVGSPIDYIAITMDDDNSYNFLETPQLTAIKSAELFLKEYK